MNTRAETITEYRAAGLEEMNMLRMNIGIEHGNYDYRRNYLKRNVKDEVQIRAFEIAAEHIYHSCANSIIGMPDENRDLIFDTIKLVRKLPKSEDATGAFIFAPYHGTALRDLSIQKGYIKDEDICSVSNTANESMLNMPTISKAEITGLNRTFSFYTKFPENRWDEIKIAENSDTAGDACVYGVVGSFNAQDKVNVVSVGIGSVRVTGACAKGDLLESNGDGTAKVQSDDIVRSKTLGKVTIGNSNTGVKLVSCVMYCG
jgi:hypothetical protein